MPRKAKKPSQQKAAAGGINNRRYGDTEIRRENKRSTAQESRLLSLPGELRNKIYELVLGGKTFHTGTARNRRGEKAVISVCVAGEDDDESTAKFIRSKTAKSTVDAYGHRHGRCDWDCVKAKMPKDFSLALLQTCKEVQDDASLLPFALNTFAFKNRYDFGNFLTKLTKPQQRSIISLSLDAQSLVTSRTWFRSLSGLESITLFHELVDYARVLLLPPHFDVAEAKRARHEQIQDYVELFHHLKFKSAKVCLYFRMMPGDLQARISPEEFKHLSEEMEAKLLKREVSAPECIEVQ